MKNLKYIIFMIFSSSIILINAMEEEMSKEEVDEYLNVAASNINRQERQELLNKIYERSKTRRNEYKQISNTSKNKSDKVLSTLTKELKKSGILINLNAKSEKEIFSFTDKLIKKGPASAKLVRKMIQEYARNENNPNWEKYPYKQFKLDIMDKIINEKAKNYEEIEVDDIEKNLNKELGIKTEEKTSSAKEKSIEQKRLEVAMNLDADLWIENEIDKNPEFLKKYSDMLSHGEKLEDLMQKSQDLQFQSKQFKKSPITQTSQSTEPSFWERTEKLKSQRANTPPAQPAQQHQSSSSGWLGGLKNWWYGPEKKK